MHLHDSSSLNYRDSCKVMEISSHQSRCGCLDASQSLSIFFLLCVSDFMAWSTNVLLSPVLPRHDERGPSGWTGCFFLWHWEGERTIDVDLNLNLNAVLVFAVYIHMSHCVFYGHITALAPCPNSNQLSSDPDPDPDPIPISFLKLVLKPPTLLWCEEQPECSGTVHIWKKSSHEPAVHLRALWALVGSALKVFKHPPLLPEHVLSVLELKPRVLHFSAQPPTDWVTGATTLDRNCFFKIIKITLNENTHKHAFVMYIK